MSARGPGCTSDLAPLCKTREVGARGGAGVGGDVPGGPHPACSAHLSSSSARAVHICLRSFVSQDIKIPNQMQAPRPPNVRQSCGVQKAPSGCAVQTQPPRGPPRNPVRAPLSRCAHPAGRGLGDLSCPLSFLKTPGLLTPNRDTPLQFPSCEKRRKLAGPGPRGATSADGGTPLPATAKARLVAPTAPNLSP